MHYNPQFLSLPAPYRSAWKRSLTWLLIVALVLLDVPLPGPHTTVATAEAHGNAARIFTIDPSCANPLDLASITGNGFETHNVKSKYPPAKPEALACDPLKAGTRGGVLRSQSVHWRRARRPGCLLGSSHTRA